MEAAHQLGHWLRQQPASNLRGSAALCRDCLLLLGGLRSATLLDADHGAALSRDPKQLREFLSAGALRPLLSPLRVLALQRDAAAADGGDSGPADGWQTAGRGGRPQRGESQVEYEALFLVHGAHLALRCKDALGEALGGGETPCWAGTCLVDASAGHGPPTLCTDGSVAAGLWKAVVGISHVV
jgi:hypothetical protein